MSSQDIFGDYFDRLRRSEHSASSSTSSTTWIPLCPLTVEGEKTEPYNPYGGKSLYSEASTPSRSHSPSRSPSRSGSIHSPSTRSSSIAEEADAAEEPFKALTTDPSLDHHAPHSIYGVPAYLEPPHRPIVKRNGFTILKTIIKSIFSAALVIGLIFGYAYSIKVVDLHVTTVGIYGTILMADFLTQYGCAILNRWDVVRIIRRKKAQMGCPPERRRRPWQIEAKQDTVLPDPFEDPEKQNQAPEVPRSHLMNPDAEISIAVVGYREDEQAWKECLRSLQKQKMKPKCVVGVVDGNDQPDLDMANAFMEEYANHNSLMVHLPVLLSAVHRKTYFDTLATFPDNRSKKLKVWHRISGHHTAAQKASLKAALDVVLKQVDEWEAEYKLSSYEALCFSQPHGHKRTAMFTAFAVSLWALKTKHAIFTTDSDTLVKDDALDEMLTLLQSNGNVGGVTADVKIWNRAESFLARLCAVRYWFAFNIERACQSWWRCVSCLSGPMSMYRAHDLHVILGMWNIQEFQGKETTFGDDRHLTNQILAQGFKTRYTHRTWCESESPTQFPRWVKQQTRWSKSFFREAFWFPHAFTLHSWWMLVEITKQSLYPFILVATVFRFLYEPTAPWRPVIWLVTMFGIALVKSVMACLISADLWLLVFSLYGFVYFFGLLPSKLFALITMNKTTWGTSARSATEIKIGASFIAEFHHLGHLVLWYLCTSFGLSFFCSVVFDMPLLALAGFAGFIPCYILFNGFPNPLTPFKFVWSKIAKVLAAICALFSSLFVKKTIKLDDDTTFTAKPSSPVERPQRPAPIIIVDEPEYEDEKKALQSPSDSPVKTREKRSGSTASMMSVDALPTYRLRANSTASAIMDQPMGRSKRAYSVASMMLEKGGRPRSHSKSSVMAEPPVADYFGADAVASGSGSQYQYKRKDSTASTMTFSAPPRYRSDSIASLAPTYRADARRESVYSLSPASFSPEKPAAIRLRSGSLLAQSDPPELPAITMLRPKPSQLKSPLQRRTSFGAGDGSAAGMTFSQSHNEDQSSVAPSGLRGQMGRRRALSRPPPHTVLAEEDDGNESSGSTDSDPGPTPRAARHRSQALGAMDYGSTVSSPLAAKTKRPSMTDVVPPPPQSPSLAALFAESYRMKDQDGQVKTPTGSPVRPIVNPFAPMGSSPSISSAAAFSAGNVMLSPPPPVRTRTGSIAAVRPARRAEVASRPHDQKALRAAAAAAGGDEEEEVSTPTFGTSVTPPRSLRSVHRISPSTPNFPIMDAPMSPSLPIFHLPLRDATSPSGTPDMERDGEHGSAQSRVSLDGYAF